MTDEVLKGDQSDGGCQQSVVGCIRDNETGWQETGYSRTRQKQSGQRSFAHSMRLRTASCAE